MSNEEKSREVYLAKPQRAALRFPRAWEDVCGQELLSLLSAPLTPSSGARSAPRIVPVRSGFELRGVSFRSLCELPFRCRTMREILWLVATGPASSKETLKSTVLESPLAWIIGAEGASVEVKAASQRSRLFHTGLIEAAVAGALREQRISVVEEGLGDVPIYAELWRDVVTLAVGLGGGSLGKRGYKVALRSPASIKEELAACCVEGFRSWAASNGIEFLPDVICVPFAGSGTFAVEALMSCASIAPVVFGRRYAVEQLACAPEKSLAFARRKLCAGDEVGLPRVICIERDEVQHQALSANLAHVERSLQNAGRKGAELSAIAGDWFEQSFVFAKGARIFLPLNPPYGERLGAEVSTAKSYRKIGASIRGMSERGAVVSGLVMCPDAATRLSFLEGLGTVRNGARETSHGGKQMQVVFFSD